MLSEQADMSEEFPHNTALGKTFLLVMTRRFAPPSLFIYQIEIVTTDNKIINNADMSAGPHGSLTDISRLAGTLIDFYSHLLSLSLFASPFPSRHRSAPEVTTIRVLTDRVNRHHV